MQKCLYPYVHVEIDNIDLYLLPKSLFKSNIKYAEYIFSLENILKPRKFEYKEITIDKAIEILISDNSSDLLYLKENYNYDILKNEGDLIVKLNIWIDVY